MRDIVRKEWKYDAFISYRHLEPDAFVAGSLHKILESYKVPANLLKEQGDKLQRTKIHKVFRDAEELPLTSNLNDTIMEALENSEYLIAICSPRFGESMWCKKEVDTFIKMHGKDHVLAVLVDGEPGESFPEELLYQEVEVQKEDGSVEIIREPMEPLAANARGANNKERLKLLKTESLRLMAPMFGCSFDDLKQRHREQRMKRIIRLVTLAASICFAFGVVSTSMALKIQKQNNQILEQNTQITEQNQQILAQSEEIDRQYREALVNAANAVSDNAMNLLEDGDRIGAIAKAYSVFPDGTENHPYVQKAEYVLTTALNLYENGRSMKPDRILKTDTVIDNVVLSPQSTRILAIDNGDTAHVWDTDTGAKLATLKLDGSIYDHEEIVFRDEDSMWVILDQQLVLYHIGDQTSEILDAGAKGFRTLSYSANTNRLLMSGSDGVRLYDTDAMKLVNKIETSDESIRSMYPNSIYVLSTEVSDIRPVCDQYFVVVFSTFTEDDSLVCVYDAVSGEYVDHMTMPNENFGTVKTYGDRIYLSQNYSEGEVMYDSKNFISDVSAYTIVDGKIRKDWTKTMHGMYNYDVVATNSGQGENLVLQFYSDIFVVKATDGTPVNQVTEVTQIIKTNGYAGSEIFSYATRDGQLCVINAAGDSINTGFFQSNGTNTKCFTLGKLAATVPYSSNILTLYRYAESPAANAMNAEAESVGEEIRPDDEMNALLEAKGVNPAFIYSVCYDTQNQFLSVSYNDRSIDVFRVDASGKVGEKCGTIRGLNTHVNQFSISPDGEYMLLAGPGMGYLYRTTGVDYTTDFPTEEMLVAVIQGFASIDYTQGCVYINNYSDGYQIPLFNAEEIRKYAEEALR